MSNKDTLGFQQKAEDGQTSTVFTLAKGTTIKIGTESFKLAQDTQFCKDGAYGRDALVGALVAGGVSSGNDQNFNYTTERMIDGKKQSVEVIYGANAAARYRLAGDEGHGSFNELGTPVEGAPVMGGASFSGISEGISAGAGVDLTTEEADKLDNPLQSMKSDAQLLQQHGPSDSKSAVAKSAPAKTEAPKAPTAAEKAAKDASDAAKTTVPSPNAAASTASKSGGKK